MSEQGTVLPAKPCPNCGGDQLYSRRLSSGDRYGPYLLRGLGSFIHYAAFDVVVCAGCGLTRFFAEPEARQNVMSNADWKRLGGDRGREAT
jgi:predicted nucleic-acid-binding Zn-ribbon protein